MTRRSLDLSDDQKRILGKAYQRYVEARQIAEQLGGQLDDLCVAIAGKGYTMRYENGEPVLFPAADSD